MSARTHGVVRKQRKTSDARSLADRVYGARDSLLESPDFQRFSASFPLTRGIAKSNARALFDLCAGFVYSQILTACVRLELFQKLSHGAKTLTELSRELDLPRPATERLMLAACSLRLVTRRGRDRFGLGMLGAALNGNPGITAMIEHHAALYRDLEDPVALLRGERGDTKLSQYWPYASSDQPAAVSGERVADYSALMAASQSFIADDVLDAYRFDRHQVLLDVGGGEGAFIAAATKRFPKLGFMLFDLPAVTDRACARLGALGLQPRVVMHGGSFLSDSLPRGADLISLVRVVHDHDDASVMRLLRAAHQALPPNGTILIAEPMSGAAGNEPVGDAYFGMYLLAMGQGRPRTPEQISGLLTQAGFVQVKARKTRRPMLVGVVTAIRQKSV